jgi:Rrf2 family nitric oxide-sensitive transcriptional repressor
MRLTSFTDYTLRVLIYLGAHHSEERLPTVSDIAAIYGISRTHLTKVVHHLAKHGYIQTLRGNGGGMRLARAPHDINIGEVVRGAEQDLAVVECFQRTDRRCTIVSVCMLRKLLDNAMKAFLAVLDKQTLADLVQPESGLLKLFQGTRGLAMP